MDGQAVGSDTFTAENIAGVLRAVLESDRTFANVSEEAETHGVSLSPFTIAYWVMRGREDIRRHEVTTAYARFARECDAELQALWHRELSRHHERGPNERTVQLMTVSHSGTSPAAGTM